MPFNPIWPAPDRNWNFDVSSLAVLIGEDSELQYRLSRRSWLQCLVAAPVVGLQNYLRSYDVLLRTGSLTYANPYGCASAPLRNSQLERAIVTNGLLEDGQFNIYRIRKEKPGFSNEFRVVFLVWCIATWLIFGGVVVFAILAPQTTWISIADVTVFTGWSIVVRTVERINVGPSEAKASDPNEPDAIYILGRDNSAFVLEGTRKDIKDWVTRGLVYRNKLPGLANLWQAFVRITSLLVLLFIFATVPNGHTMDQLAFIILLAIAQANVIFGQWWSGKALISKFERVELDPPTVYDSRTKIYGQLIKRFADLDKKNSWVINPGLLPSTEKWALWKTDFLKDPTQDPKAVWNSLPGR